MPNSTECPSCHAILASDEVVGIENADYYDGIIALMCPACGHKWPRFEAIEGNEMSAVLHNKGVNYLQMDGAWED